MGAVLLLSALLQQSGTALAQDQQLMTKPVIYTVNYPLAYFAERIAGDAVVVHFPVPPGEDPAYWQPNSDEIAAYQKADLVLLNGADYAKWVETVTLPTSKTVNTSKSLENKYIKLTSGTTHSHGSEDEHVHYQVAHTTWIDPAFAIAQGQAILEALKQVLPEQADDLQARFDSLNTDLAMIDNAIADHRTKWDSQPLFASRPIFQYLARWYELDITNVSWKPDEVPNGTQWNTFDKLLETHEGYWMIWNTEPGEDTRKELRKRGVGNIVFDPCANKPAEGDYLTVMKENVKQMDKMFGF